MVSNAGWKFLVAGGLLAMGGYSTYTVTELQEKLYSIEVERKEMIDAINEERKQRAAEQREMLLALNEERKQRTLEQREMIEAFKEERRQMDRPSQPEKKEEEKKEKEESNEQKMIPGGVDPTDIMGKVDTAKISQVIDDTKKIMEMISLLKGIFNL